MPKISIVIAAYNIEAYLGGCLNSLRNQTLDDIQIIVVNDGSQDGTAAIAQSHAAEDSRVLVLDNGENKGRFVTRINGLRAATGDYIMFVDGDDELASEACEVLLDEMVGLPADILHFGTNVIPVLGATQAEAEGLTAFMNPAEKEIRKPAILTDCFLDEGHDFCIHHKLYRTSFLKKALEGFAADIRLDAAEDMVTYFVIAMNARRYRALADTPYYQYYLGRGITAANEDSLDKFRQTTQAKFDCLAHLKQYLQSLSGDQATVWQCYKEVRDHLVAHAVNIWQDSLPLSAKDEAMGLMCQLWPLEVVAENLYRCMRDTSYYLVKHGEDDPAYAQNRGKLDEMLRLEQKYFADFAFNVDGSQAGPGLQATVQGNLEILDRCQSQKAQREAFDASPVKIFVATRDDVSLPNSRYYFPIQCGTATCSHVHQGMIHDNIGDNISEKNGSYCELTAQYWAWKNVDAEYFGFCHYRRYFDFSDNASHQLNPWGEIEAGYLTPEACQEYGMTDEAVERAIDGADMVVTTVKDVSEFPEGYTSLQDHWIKSPFLIPRDIEIMRDVIAELSPDYLGEWDAFASNSCACFCNMYVLRKQHFHAYCQWMFPLLAEAEKRIDMSLYSVQSKRVLGHLSERLFNVFLRKMMQDQPDLVVREVPCVRFGDVSRSQGLRRAFDGNCIPVVFAADNEYSPMLATAIRSMVENASRQHQYDIVVLHRDITNANMEFMQRMLKNFPHVSLRFYNVSRMVKDYKLEANAHISTETYYRFLIQDVLPSYDKIVYLDSDLVVEGDISELYQYSVDGLLLAATHDSDYLGNLNLDNGERLNYSLETLKMKDPYTYFQAGVIVFNEREMRKYCGIEEWLERAAVPYKYNDQDILNTWCEGRVNYLPDTWNMLMDCGRFAAAIQYGPAKSCQAYLDSRKNPEVVHFAGGIKPWNDPLCDFSEAFWKYARMTPYYEELIRRMVRKDPVLQDVMYKKLVQRHGTRSFKRRVFDAFFPIGSEARESIKSLARRIRR